MRITFRLDVRVCSKIVFFNTDFNFAAQVSHQDRRDDRKDLGQHATPASRETTFRPRKADRIK